MGDLSRKRDVRQERRLLYIFHFGWITVVALVALLMRILVGPPEFVENLDALEEADRCPRISYLENRGTDRSVRVHTLITATHPVALFRSVTERSPPMHSAGGFSGTSSVTAPLP